MGPTTIDQPTACVNMFPTSRDLRMRDSCWITTCIMHAPHVIKAISISLSYPTINLLDFQKVTTWHITLRLSAIHARTPRREKSKPICVPTTPLYAVGVGVGHIMLMVHNRNSFYKSQMGGLHELSHEYSTKDQCLHKSKPSTSCVPLLTVGWLR